MAQQNERLQGQLASATEQLTEMRYNLDIIHKESQVDPLTEVGNRKFFDREIEHAVAEASETGAPLTLLMIDIDHFKKFNDSYGHQVGDQVLRLVARTLVESLKGRDVIARYGGEEFVILLPQTKVVDAEKVANQLRATLSTKQLKRRSTNESLGVITVSIGAAEYAKGEHIDRFIERSDQSLYKAKQTGRNRVVTSVLSAEELAGLAASVERKADKRGTAA
jgi:diguanylate cyclase